MAFRWRADDGPTFNAGLVDLRISGDPVQYCYEILNLSVFQWRSGPPAPSLDPRMGPDNVYTYCDILKTHFIVCIGFCRRGGQGGRGYGGVECGIGGGECGIGGGGGGKRG